MLPPPCHTARGSASATPEVSHGTTACSQTPSPLSRSAPDGTATRPCIRQTAFTSTGPPANGAVGSPSESDSSVQGEVTGARDARSDQRDRPCVTHGTVAAREHSSRRCRSWIFWVAPGAAEASIDRSLPVEPTPVTPGGYPLGPRAVAWPADVTRTRVGTGRTPAALARTSAAAQFDTLRSVAQRRGRHPLT